MKKIVLIVALLSIFTSIKTIAQEEKSISSAIEALQANNYEKAIDIYTEIINNYDKYAPAFYGRGIAYYNLNENKKAFSDFEKATKLQENYSDALLGLALIKLQEGQNDKAISYLNEVLNKNPNSNEALYSRGLAYYLEADYNTAVTDFTAASSSHTNYS